jgi:hypothetical protein
VIYKGAGMEKDGLPYLSWLCPFYSNYERFIGRKDNSVTYLYSSVTYIMFSDNYTI